MTNTRILIDTDAGVDDMRALFVLFQIVPESVVDVAVTFGNVPLDQASYNVGLFSLVSGFNPRQMFRGLSGPFHGEPHFAFDVHGGDGLSGITHREYRNATVKALTDDLTLTARAGCYRKIIALGPLTDVAVLTRNSRKPPALYVMGGAFDVPGNVSPFGEFNFYSDPHAAAEVFDRYKGKIFVIPLDVCNQIVLYRQYFNALCDEYPGAMVNFIRAIHQDYMSFYHRVEGIDGCHPHDAIAVCAALFDDKFSWERGRVSIVADGPRRGYSAFTTDGLSNHYVARRIDSDWFFGVLERAIAGHDSRRVKSDASG